ncbi:MAG: 2-hydroxychromene-2-carboxylate isomerase [Halieaceae bacterium]|jgi:2-hydroxychromene-2-carboxylate isomerase
MTKLEFFFDCSSPWTYLGFTGIQPICEKYGVDIIWRPILVGGIFNEVNQGLYSAREAMFKNERRVNHYLKDLNDWANYENITIQWPAFHPVNSVKAMRGCLHAESHELMIPYAKAVFEAYWGLQENISEDEVLARIVISVGMNTEEFFSSIAEQSCKDHLRDNTDELITRGGYGSPTIYINDEDMYFGNDRLPLIAAKLEQLAE